ncbi:hypothetical protein IWX76_000348 [Pedobacter sp. CAN_A7]
MREIAAIPMVAKLFGFARVTEDLRKFLSAAIEHAVEKRVVLIDGEFLKISN